jgi:hypothetical protein
MIANHTTAGASKPSGYPDTNKPVQVHDGMLVEGWVTIGYYDNDIGPTVYGLFETMEQAQDWLRKLKSGYTHVVYTPQYNRG